MSGFTGMALYSQSDIKAALTNYKVGLDRAKVLLAKLIKEAEDSWQPSWWDKVRGWEPKYAVLPLGKVKDYIININGNIYSPASLLRHFNLTKGILTPTNKNPMLRDRLILKGTITEDDYFELIHIN